MVSVGVYVKHQIEKMHNLDVKRPFMKQTTSFKWTISWLVKHAYYASHCKSAAAVRAIAAHY